jgi:carbon storage regulator CsrA
MLVLTRKCGQELTVGEAVVKVLAVHVDGRWRMATVRLGVTAPKHVPICREEAKNHEPPPHRAGDGEGAFQ